MALQSFYLDISLSLYSTVGHKPLQLLRRCYTMIQKPRLLLEN
jgi:hypothetical protein